MCDDDLIKNCLNTKYNAHSLVIFAALWDNSNGLNEDTTGKNKIGAMLP